MNIFEQEEINKLHQKIESIKLDYIGLSGVSRRDSARFRDISNYKEYYNTIKDEDKQFYYDTIDALHKKLSEYLITDKEIEVPFKIPKRLR